MNKQTKPKQTHRYREQIGGYQMEMGWEVGEGREGRSIIWSWMVTRLFQGDHFVVHTDVMYT